MTEKIQGFQARTLRGMSYVARSLMGSILFVLFLCSISSLWDWPIARCVLSFAMLAGFFLTASKRELGGHLAFCRAGKVSRLSIDAKLSGLEVLISVALNGFLILRHVVTQT
jgi:hypothetical protein